MSGCHARCRRCRDSSGDPGLIQFDLAAVAVLALIAGIAWLVMVPLRIWHVTGADGRQHPDAATWAAYGCGGAAVMGALMFFSVRAARRRELASAAKVPPAMPPEPPLPRRAAAQGFPPPACRHPRDRAEPVRNILTGRLEAWLCLDCDAQLDPGAVSAELTPDASWPPIRKPGR